MIMKEILATGNFGTGKEGLITALEEAEASTKRENLFSDCTKIFIYTNETKKSGGKKELLLRNISFTQIERRDKGLAASRHTCNVPEGSALSAFMDTVICTGLMFVRDEESDPEYFAVSENAMQALCAKISLSGTAATRGNRFSRNYYLADMLLLEKPALKGKTLLDTTSFVCRNFSPGKGDGMYRVITGVTSTRYCRTPRTAVLDLLDTLEKTNIYGAPEVGKWSVTEQRTHVEILFPGIASKRTLPDGKEMAVTPSVLITDSDCGCASWIMDGSAAAGRGRKALTGKRKKHDRSFDPVEVALSWLKEEFFPAFGMYLDSMDGMEKTPVAGRTPVEKAVDLHGKKIREETGRLAWEAYREKAVQELSVLPACTELDVEAHILRGWDNSGEKAGRRPRPVMPLPKKERASGSGDGKTGGKAERSMDHV